MIAFDLQCANGHTFEGWFEDSDSYQKRLVSPTLTFVGGIRTTIFVESTSRNLVVKRTDSHDHLRGINIAQSRGETDGFARPSLWDQHHTILW